MPSLQVQLPVASASTSTLSSLDMTPTEEKPRMSLQLPRAVPLYAVIPPTRPPAPTRLLPLTPADDSTLSILKPVGPSSDDVPDSPLPPDDTDLEKPLVDWRALLNYRTYLQRKHIPKYLILFFLLATSVPVAIEHKPLVDWLHPYIIKLKHLPAGWLIPIVILFIISFPPLFGHEIIAVLVGLVWGFGLGFAIVAAGSVLGEIGNFYAFRVLFLKRGLRAERTNLRYACLARVIREGGFVIALVARLSVIPGHLTTAIFSTCGMNFWVFTVAAALSMPKQMATVYLGVVLYITADGHTPPRIQALSACIVILTVLFSGVAGVYIYWKMAMKYPEIIAERRFERAQRRLAVANASRTTLSLSMPTLSYEGPLSPAPADLESGNPSTLFLAVPSSSSNSTTSSDSDKVEKEPSAAVLEIERGQEGVLRRLLRRGVGLGGEGRRPRIGRAVSDVVLPIVAPQEPPGMEMREART